MGTPTISKAFPKENQGNIAMFTAKPAAGYWQKCQWGLKAGPDSVK